MSKVSKGNAFQDWIAKWLKKQNPDCIIHNQKSVSKQVFLPGRGAVWVSKRNDVFGEIDLIVLYPEDKPLFIQATCDSSIGRKEEALQKIPWPLPHICVELWQKRGPGRVIIKELDPLHAGFIKTGEIIRGKWRGV